MTDQIDQAKQASQAAAKAIGGAATQIASDATEQVTHTATAAIDGAKQIAGNALKGFSGLLHRAAEKIEGK